MRAIAVHPGQPNSMHLREIPEPDVTHIERFAQVVEVGPDVPSTIRPGTEMIRRLTEDREAIKVYVEVAGNGNNG